MVLGEKALGKQSSDTQHHHQEETTRRISCQLSRTVYKINDRELATAMNGDAGGATCYSWLFRMRFPFPNKIYKHQRKSTSCWNYEMPWM